MRSRSHVLLAPTLLACLGLACAPASRSPRAITILVDTGRFASPESAAAAAGRIDWWDDDRADDEASTQSFAALELRDGLRRVTGLDARHVTVSNRPALPAAGDVIVLADPSSVARLRTVLGAAGAGGAVPPFPDAADGFELATTALGARRLYGVRGGGRTGVLYGAYALLEELGVRFDGPGDSGTIVPRLPVALPARIARAESPRFDTRGFWAWEARGDSAFFLWMARNRMNLWTTAERDHGRLAQLGIRLAAGGHMVQHDFLDPRRYFATHPEWYGLRDGRRRGDIGTDVGTNFCTSNTAATRELARNLIHALAGGALREADQVNLWPLDNGKWCQCPNCAAQGNAADRWMAVMATVGAEVERARRAHELRRSVLLIAPAYLETWVAPTRPLPAGSDLAPIAVTFFPYYRCYAHTFADSTCLEINRPLMSCLAGWARATQPAGATAPAATLMIGEYYNVSWHKSLPVLFPHVMARDLASYAALGVRHFHYMHAPTRRLGSWTLQHHLLARLLWNPDQSVDSLIDAFVAREHPSAPVAMKEFYAALEQATANITALQRTLGATGAGNARLTNPAFPVFPFAHFQYAASSAGHDSAASLDAIAGAMVQARAALDRARTATQDPAERARLDDVAARFDYGEAMFRFYTGILVTTVMDRQHDPRAAASFAALAPLVTQLRGVTDLVQVSASHANAADGYEAAQVQKIYEFLRARYGRASSAGPRAR